MIAPLRPPQDDLQLLIKEARERQVRRRLLGVAGLAIAAAIGLSVYALTIGGGANGTGEDSASVGGAPICRASQVSAVIVFGAATGSALGGATITNRSDASCSLPRGRPVVAVTADGRRLTVKEEVPPPGWGGGGSPVRVVMPGAKAVVWLQWFNWCGGYVPVTFTLQFRGLRLSANQHAGPRCDSTHYPSSIFVSTLSRPQ